MDRPPESVEHRFMHHLTERRVWEDGVHQLFLRGLEAHGDTTVLRASTSAIIAMDMINTIPPFDNKLVRQAMQAATDRVAIN